MLHVIDQQPCALCLSLVDSKYSRNGIQILTECYRKANLYGEVYSQDP